MAMVEGATHIVRYANPAFCHLVEKPLEQLVGSPISKLLPEKDHCIPLLEQVFRTGKPLNHTEKDPSKSEPAFWSYTMWPLRTDELLVGVMIQVTESTKAHETAVAMNEALTEAAELMGEGLTTSLSMKYARHAPDSYKVHLRYGRLTLADVKQACDATRASNPKKNKHPRAEMSNKDLLQCQKEITAELARRDALK